VTTRQRQQPKGERGAALLQEAAEGVDAIAPFSAVSPAAAARLPGGEGGGP
jgi:hypothetical protein